MPDHTFHDLLPNGHGRIKAGHRILEYHGDSFAVDMPADPLFVFFQNIYRFCSSICMMIGKLNGSVLHCGVGGQNSHCRLHGNGFTRSGLTYDSNGLSSVKVDIDTTDGMDHSGSGFKGDIQVMDIKNFFFIV